MADAALYALVWDEARVKEAMAEASKEVKFLWGQFKISLQAQARLAELGFTDVEIFASMEDSEAKVRAFILGGLGFRQDTEFVAKGTVARIISAWTSAQQRGEKRAAADADQRVGDLPRTLPRRKHLELIRAHNKLHKELVEKDVPYAGCVETKLDQLEADEFFAPQLTEVASRDEGCKEERIISQLTTAGTIVQKKYATVKVPRPANTEDLRYRLKLEASTWELARLEQSNNEVIADLKRDDWQDHLDFILGDKIYGRRASAGSGSFIYKPPWDMVLEIEYQIRKRACYLVNTTDPQMTMAAALRAARVDRELLQDHFLTPISLAAGAEAALSAGPGPKAPPVRNRSPASRTPSLTRAQRRRQRLQRQKKTGSPPPVPVPKRGPGIQKTKVKDQKEEQKGKCFKFNRGQCKNKKCKWSHSCSVCEKPGCAAWKHDEAAKKKTG